MYNLLVSASGWSESRDSMSATRTLEYTEQYLIDKFRVNGVLDLNSLILNPCLFLEETYCDKEQIVHVGTIIRANISGHDILLEYTYDPSIPPFTNNVLEGMASDLGIADFEFSRTHWAVKDIDLFRVLLRNLQPQRQKPKVFSILEPERIEPTLISAMMPFDPSFNAVYTELQRVSKSVGFHCRRADDIWENPAVIQDVVSLIDRSKIVICDCSGRNPNVFYEIGIAHTLGRETILITQSESDIPFDLRHLRYVKYLNNGEGLRALSDTLLPRLKSLS